MATIANSVMLIGIMQDAIFDDEQKAVQFRLEVNEQVKQEDGKWKEEKSEFMCYAKGRLYNRLLVPNREGKKIALEGRLISKRTQGNTFESLFMVFVEVDDFFPIDR